MESNSRIERIKIDSRVERIKTEIELLTKDEWVEILNFMLEDSIWKECVEAV